MARLGDIATYVNGYAFKPSDWSDIGIPIIRIQDLTGNSYQANRYNGEYDKRYEIHDGDVLISWSASLGVYVWTGEKAVLNQHIFKVVFNKVEVDKSFFVHQVRNMLENAASQAHGATMKHLTKPVFDALPFNLPSVVEQQRISSVLDKLTNLISLRKQQLAKLDELVKARFVEMFGDSTTNSKELKIVRLSEIAEYFNGLTYRPENVSDVGTIVLRSSNIQGNQLDFADTVRVNCQIKERLFVKENDILMCSRNGSARLVGKVALIKGLNEPMSFGAFMMIIRSQYYPYLMTYFQTDDFRRQIKTGATTTINQVTGRMLDEVELPVPELGNMTAFATFTEKIFRQKLTIQQSLDKLEVLRKSLMQEYFG